jgi:hypothetical protein
MSRSSGVGHDAKPRHGWRRRREGRRSLDRQLAQLGLVPVQLRDDPPDFAWDRVALLAAGGMIVAGALATGYAAALLLGLFR